MGHKIDFPVFKSYCLSASVCCPLSQNFFPICFGMKEFEGCDMSTQTGKLMLGSHSWLGRKGASVEQLHGKEV